MVLSSQRNDYISNYCIDTEYNFLSNILLRVFCSIVCFQHKNILMRLIFQLIYYTIQIQV